MLLEITKKNDILELHTRAEQVASVLNFDFYTLSSVLPFGTLRYWQQMTVCRSSFAFCSWFEMLLAAVDKICNTEQNCDGRRARYFQCWSNLCNIKENSFNVGCMHNSFLCMDKQKLYLQLPYTYEFENNLVNHNFIFSFIFLWTYIYV